MLDAADEMGTLESVVLWVFSGGDLGRAGQSGIAADDVDGLKKFGLSGGISLALVVVAVLWRERTLWLLWPRWPNWLLCVL